VEESEDTKMKTFIFSILLAAACVARADQEGPRDIYVVGNRSWYAKAVPDGDRFNRDSGQTLIFLARKDGDDLIHTFDWYASRLYITGHGGGWSVVRVGHWPRGRTIKDNDLAIAFYRDGELLKQYSTAELADPTMNPEFSASHYRVIKEFVGFVYIYEENEKGTVYSKPDYGFELVLVDGRTVVFDPKTGSRVLMGFNMHTRRVAE
jgi:hypothetical protein